MRDLKPIKSATGSWGALAARAELTTELRSLLEYWGWHKLLLTFAALASSDDRGAIAEGLHTLAEQVSPPKPGVGDPRSPEEMAAAWAKLLS